MAPSLHRLAITPAKAALPARPYTATGFEQECFAGSKSLFPSAEIGPSSSLLYSMCPSTDSRVAAEAKNRRRMPAAWQAEILDHLDGNNDLLIPIAVVLFCNGID
jgi:hypothetical protein